MLFIGYENFNKLICDFKLKFNFMVSFKSCFDVKYYFFYILGDKLYWFDSYMNIINYIGLDGINWGELIYDFCVDIMYIVIFGFYLYYIVVNR